MNKETLLIAGVFVGTLIVANYVMGMKVPKKAEPMSNASGDGRGRAKKDGTCQCKRGVIGYCGNKDCNCWNEYEYGQSFISFADANQGELSYE